jgi:hypothetical protein
MAFDVDFTSLEERNMVRSRDVNLFYDPVNGYSKDPILFGPSEPGVWSRPVADERRQDREPHDRHVVPARFNNNFQASAPTHARCR